MGCDIHSHIEVYLAGKWEHWHTPQIERDYSLFGMLAGVRRPELALFGEPRGLPEDLTVPTKWDYEISFGHTASWITWEELNKIIRIMDKAYPDGHQIQPIMEYVYDNDYTPYDEITNIRMVFWFDN